MISIQAKSNRGKSRIGTQIVSAFVEQCCGDRLFIVMRNEAGEITQCRWIKAKGDPDFRIIDPNLPV